MKKPTNKTPHAIAFGALVLSLSLSAFTAPSAAMTPDMSGLTPVLTFPEPASPQPVTRDATEVGN